ncbi:hypothetical protein ABK040_008835 [Willaertia magna]
MKTNKSTSNNNSEGQSVLGSNRSSYEKKNLQHFRLPNESPKSKTPSPNCKQKKIVPIEGNLVSSSISLKTLSPPSSDKMNQLLIQLKENIQELYKECTNNGTIENTNEAFSVLNNAANNFYELVTKQGTATTNNQNFVSSTNSSLSITIEDLFNDKDFGTQGKDWASCCSSNENSPPSSPVGLSIQERLSSPNRKKLSPDDIIKKQEEKMAKSAWNRKSIQMQQQVKFLKEAEKQKEVIKRREKTILENKQKHEAKQERARKNVENHKQKVAEEARKESEKVDEVKFIQSLNIEKNKFDLERKLGASQERKKKELDKLKEKLNKDIEKEKAAKIRREQLEIERQHLLQGIIKAKEKKEETIKEKKEKENAERNTKKIEYELKIERTKKETQRSTKELSEKLVKKLEASVERKIKTLEDKKAKAASDLKKVEEARKRAQSPTKLEILTVEDQTEIENSRKSLNKKFKKAYRKFEIAFASIEKKLLIPKPVVKNPLFKKTIQHVKSPTNQEVLLSALGAIERITKIENLDSFRELIDIFCQQLLDLKIQSIERQAYAKALNSICNSKDNVLYINSKASTLVCPLVKLMTEISIVPTVQYELVPLMDILIKLLTSTTAETLELEITFKDYLVDFILNSRLLMGIRAQIRSESLQTMQQQQFTPVILKCLELILTITNLPVSKVTYIPIYVRKRGNEIENCVNRFRESNLVGILPLLSTILLENGQLKGITKPEISDTYLRITFMSIKTLNNLASIDINFIQQILGDTFQTELFHILGYLFSYFETVNYKSIVIYENNNIVSPTKVTTLDLLNEIILLVGYFSLENESNQEMLHYHSARNPTLLQRMSVLLKNFPNASKDIFSILLPTLICACYDNETNREILRNEISLNIITQYISQHVESLKNLNVKAKLKTPFPRFLFENRFPIKKMQDAALYFLVDSSETKQEISLNTDDKQSVVDELTNNNNDIAERNENIEERKTCENELSFEEIE